MYLEIRFIDYEALDIEGDNLMGSLEEAMEYGKLSSESCMMTGAQ